MKKENKISINNLIYALLFFVFGMILITSTEDLISIASKIIGVALIIIGIIKSIIYIYMKGKLGDYNLSQLMTGLLIIIIGILFIIYSGALSFAIRNIIGLWILFSGINKIIFAISIKKIDKSGFKVYITTSILMIIIGICLISGLVDRIIGLFIIGYSIIEIVNYIYYKSKDKNYESVNKEPNLKIKKLKSSKVIDAVIDEEKN